jgi:CubicO group peptidase (beta-lactamase class C family)
MKRVGKREISVQNRRTFLKRAVGGGVAAGAGLASGPALLVGERPARAATAEVQLGGRRAPRRVGAPRPELEAFLRSQAEAGQVPGFAACVAVGSEIAWGYAHGVADHKRGDRMTLLSSQAIASITKTWTTTALLHAQQHGHLGFDEPLETYLPYRVRNPYAPDSPITLRHILTHTSSLGDGAEPGSYGAAYRQLDPYATLADEWAELIFGVDGELYDPELEFFYEVAPGDEHIYGNSPWSLCAAALREATGLAYPNYARRHIFRPLRLENTSFVPSELRWRSTQHALVEDGEKVPDSGFGLYSNLFRYPREGPIRQGLEAFSGYIPYGPYSYPAYPDGGLYTNALDLARYLGMWMNNGKLDGRRVLARATVESALEVALPEDMTPDEGHVGGQGYLQCLGWREDRAARGVYVHHGEDLGTATVAAFALPERVGVAVITNVEGAGFEFNTVARRLLEEFGGPEIDV